MLLMSQTFNIVGRRNLLCTTVSSTFLALPSFICHAPKTIMCAACTEVETESNVLLDAFYKMGLKQVRWKLCSPVCS
jgi:hypothetical protein